MLGSHPGGTPNTLAAVLAPCPTCGRHRPESSRAGVRSRDDSATSARTSAICSVSPVPHPPILWCKTLNSGRMAEPPERPRRSGRLQLAVTTSDRRFRVALAPGRIEPLRTRVGWTLLSGKPFWKAFHSSTYLRSNISRRAASW
jgi:hypothetical protein